MQIGQAVLMIEDQHEILQYFWDLILFPGVLENKVQCQDQALKLNTRL
jgi:hypothetical protein